MRLMVTMDRKQGLEDFQRELETAGVDDQLYYLHHGETY